MLVASISVAVLHFDCRFGSFTSDASITDHASKVTATYFVNLRRAMDSSFGSNRLNIFDIYRRYCEITSEVYTFGGVGGDGYRRANELNKAKLYRDALSHLLQLVDSRVDKRMPIVEEIPILMSRLDPYLVAEACTPSYEVIPLNP
ncbi:hypothetical protein L1887_26728 [Cichorium endivia]|nr:hypothetical protein L1887_26728 [Cichorium endivia]